MKNTRKLLALLLSLALVFALIDDRYASPTDDAVQIR